MPARRQVPDEQRNNAMISVDETTQVDEKQQEEDLRKRFEPVAPWNRPNIPDYGPLKNSHHLLVFFIIGLLATLAYEYTDYFDQINRSIAYAAIWFPLWFRLLGQVSPAAPEPTEEEIAAKEREELQRELERIAKEADVDK